MKTSTKYLIYGSLFGLMFPVIAILFDTLMVHKLSFSLDNFILVFSGNFLHIIIATAPIFLGAAFFMVGIKADELAKKNASLKASNEAMFKTVKALDSFNYDVTHDLKSSMVEAEMLARMIFKYSDSPEQLENLVVKLVSTAQEGNAKVSHYVNLLNNTYKELEVFTSSNNDNDDIISDSASISLETILAKVHQIKQNQKNEISFQVQIN